MIALNVVGRTTELQALKAAVSVNAVMIAAVLSTHQIAVLALIHVFAELHRAACVETEAMWTGALCHARVLIDDLNTKVVLLRHAFIRLTGPAFRCLSRVNWTMALMSANLVNTNLPFRASLLLVTLIHVLAKSFK